MATRSKCQLVALWSIFLTGTLVPIHSGPINAQAESEHFWLAGRYDGNRVIIYFDAVKLNNTVPTNARRITDPVAPGFLMPVELPASYISRFQNHPDAAHFAIGEHYDVLTDGRAIEVTLTSLVGTEGDEQVGNDSYIGALAIITSKCPIMDEMYFAVRPHRGPTCDSPRQAWPGGKFPTRFAEMLHEPVQFDVQTRIVSLLTQRMTSIASAEQQHAAQSHSPEFTVQCFRLADGSLRYYATAQWKLSAQSTPSDLLVGAWLSPTPDLHILAIEKPNFDVSLPTILNVADLGGGKTGIILSTSAEDSNATVLVEYRDGLDLAHMPLLQSISAGE